MSDKQIKVLNTFSWSLKDPCTICDTYTRVHLYISAHPPPKSSPNDSGCSLNKPNGRTSTTTVAASAEHPKRQRPGQEQEHLYHKKHITPSEHTSVNAEAGIHIKELSQQMAFVVGNVENLGNELPPFKKAIDEDMHHVMREISSMLKLGMELNIGGISERVRTVTTMVEESRQQIYDVAQDVNSKTELSRREIEKISTCITEQFLKVDNEITILLEMIGTNCEILKESITEPYEKADEILTKIEHDLSFISVAMAEVRAFNANIDKITGDKMALSSKGFKNVYDNEQLIKEDAEYKRELKKEVNEVRKVACESSKILNILNEQRNKQLSSVAKELCDLRDFVRGCVLGLPILIVVCLAIGVCLTSIPSMTLWTSNIPVSVVNNDQMVVNKPHEFHFNLKQIKQDFPSETDRLWSSVFAPIHRVIQDEDPSRPAVILIVTARSTRTVAECLARKVATVVEALYDLVPGESNPYLTLEAKKMKALTPDGARSEMEKALSGNFEEGHIAAVIHDLGSLPSEAAVIMHAYCRHESTRFQKAVILVTAYLDSGVTVTAEHIEAYLSNAWKELGEDILNNLLSKFVSNVAVMTAERTVDHCRMWEL